MAKSKSIRSIGYPGESLTDERARRLRRSIARTRAGHQDGERRTSVRSLREQEAPTTELQPKPRAPASAIPGVGDVEPWRDRPVREVTLIEASKAIGPIAVAFSFLSGGRGRVK